MTFYTSTSYRKGLDSKTLHHEGPVPLFIQSYKDTSNKRNPSKRYFINIRRRTSCESNSTSRNWTRKKGYEVIFMADEVLVETNVIDDVALSEDRVSHFRHLLLIFL